MNLVADIFNQALDAIGNEVVVGDPQEGTREAQVLLRAYSQCLRQLLRSAHWNCARKQAPMLLLADATAQTPNVGTIVPVPWIYEYALPTDCVQARFVPANPWCPPGSQIPPGNIQTPNVPQTSSNTTAPLAGYRLSPARFLLTSDYNNLPAWTTPNYDTIGVSPISRMVICTNVKNAMLVYTALQPYPSMWDPLFREALVAMLASRVALPLNKDKKFGAMLKKEQIAIASGAVNVARVRDGDEGWYNSDIAVDWMNVRGRGASWGSGGDGGQPGGPGYFWCSWDSGTFGSTGNTGAY